MDTFFKKTKNTFKNAFLSIIKEYGVDHAILEAAFVAYAHKNPLIDFLFWRRIYLSYKYMKERGYKSILDFGTGSGVMAYLAAEKKDADVVAIDVDYDPLEKIKKYVSFPQNIKFIDGKTNLAEEYKNKFDIIFALDVLEHIEDIDDLIKAFKVSLKKDGVVIVSGPTENFLYQIGRKIAGKDFSGEYHVSNIYNIKESFKKLGKVKTIHKLYWPFTLFEIFTVQFKGNGSESS